MQNKNVFQNYSDKPKYQKLKLYRYSFSELHACFDLKSTGLFSSSSNINSNPVYDFTELYIGFIY